MLRNLLAHVSSYTLGSAFATLASVISFPLIARHFSVADYGVINLISVALLLLVSVAKGGVQNSIMRFYAEERARNDPVGMHRYQATVVYGILGTGVLVTLVWLAVLPFLPASTWRDVRVPGLLVLASALIAIRSLDSALINLLRAQQRSGIYSLYQISKRYCGLAGLIVVFVVIDGHVTAYYASMVVTELAVGLGLAWVMFRGAPIRPWDFSLTSYRRMIAFGVPLIGIELTAIVLNLGDRYVLNGMLGKEAVGIYSAAANLCDYVDQMFIFSLGQAVQPIYLRTWEERGERETVAVLERAFHVYIIFAALIIAGVSAIGRELLLVLASSKYLAAGAVIPWAITGLLLRGSSMIFGAGLYIHRQTRTMFVLTAAATAINIALNFALIPVFGIAGSAIATLVTYVLLSGALYRMSRSILRVPVPWGTVGRYAVVAVLLYAAVEPVSFPSVWATLAGKLCAGAVVFGLSCWLLDPEVRRWSRAGIEQLRAWT
jgi:O-antigen/teichoic acid export membrane protein